MLPGERAYLEERDAFLATIESLSDDELEHAPTLCAGWAPRDVLAHVIGIDARVGAYVRDLGHVNRANARIVAEFRELPLDELRARARSWAATPALHARAAAFQLLCDLAVHHQDVLRGLGRSRKIPEASANAILREGVILGGARLLTHRVVPVDSRWMLGRGRVVRGTREALGLWLAGRRGIEAELTFEP